MPKREKRKDVSMRTTAVNNVLVTSLQHPASDRQPWHQDGLPWHQVLGFFPHQPNLHEVGIGKLAPAFPSQQPHRRFAALAKIHGDVMTIGMGSEPWLVLSSPKLCTKRSYQRARILQEAHGHFNEDLLGQQGAALSSARCLRLPRVAQLPGPFIPHMACHTLSPLLLVATHQASHAEHQQRSCLSFAALLSVSSSEEWGRQAHGSFAQEASMLADHLIGGGDADLQASLRHCVTNMVLRFAFGTRCPTTWRRPRSRRLEGFSRSRMPSGPTSTAHQRSYPTSWACPRGSDGPRSSTPQCGRRDRLLADLISERRAVLDSRVDVEEAAIVDVASDSQMRICCTHSWTCLWLGWAQCQLPSNGPCSLLRHTLFQQERARSATLRSRVGGVASPRIGALTNEVLRAKPRCSFRAGRCAIRPSPASMCLLAGGVRQSLCTHPF